MLLQHGADASRVEASLQQMEAGLGIERIDVVVMSKTLLLTATRQDAHHTRRPGSRGGPGEHEVSTDSVSGDSLAEDRLAF